MPAPDAIKKLVDQFQYNLREYKNPKYNETQVRVEFINPFWEALGWDVNNRAGYAMAFRDVVHEDEIKIGGSTKAPDYSFRIGGRRIFFLEAKKPSRDLKHDPEPAFQLRRYAYSAKLPVSMITDFEELGIYDTRLKPAITDKSHVARMTYYHFTQYLDKWDEINDSFSKEAVLRGAFDRFVDDNQSKKGVAELDRDFLNSLDEWRILLARNIALRNPDLSERELNFAVQKTIDRLIFLRMAEDRSIETYGTLQTLCNGENAYKRLVHIYDRADERYNSGLFHFSEKDGDHPDTITPGLQIDDKVLKEIIKNLYYPCPYEFSQLPVEVLGNAYEQFLGKRISLTGGHRAKIEEKPEVRKAGGVYYTPQYIVDYIVEHTVGELVKDKSPKQVSELRVLDPACGSGSFLLGAYQYLLDWHLKAYTAEYERTDVLPTSPVVGKPRKSDPQAIFQDQTGQWALTTAEKKRILLNNIYGVDIDSNAVEVTKLSLLLKVLENESSETLNRQLGLFHERALPNLAGNIKCGNSLIGPDYYDNQQSALFDETEMMRVNVFDWQKEFADIFAQGGFDVVIGNPPYVFGRDWKSLGINDSMKFYLRRIYQSSPYQLDFFSIFMEKVSLLSKLNGRIGQIVPNVWLTNTYSKSTRSFVLSQANNLTVTVPPADTFGKLTVDTIVYTYKKSTSYSNNFLIKQFDVKESTVISEFRTVDFVSGDKPIPTNINNETFELLNNLRERGKLLSDLALITRGVHPYRLGGYGQSAFQKGPQIEKDLEARPYHSSNKKEGFRPFIYGKNLKRFSPVEYQEFVKYGPWLAEPRNPIFFEGERVYSRKILGKRLIVTFEKENSVTDQQVYISKPISEKISAAYLTGILGSKLLAFYIRNYYDEVNDAFPQIKVSQLKQLPIAINEQDKAQHDRLVALVQQMLDLHKTLSTARDPRTREQLHRHIESTDHAIDRLVYELYDLTEEEIRIVESNSDS